MNIPGIKKIESIMMSNVELPVFYEPETITLEDYLADELDEIEHISETAGLNVIENESLAGVFFDVEVPFTIASLDEAANCLFMATTPHLFVLHDKSGQKYVIGNNTEKPRFSYEAKSDPTGQGGRSIACKIAWRTRVWPILSA